MIERLVARTAIMRPIGVTRPPWNPYLGECYGRARRVCVHVYDRERCRGENMHLLRVPALGWDTGHACHDIEKERGARVYLCLIYGEDSNRECRWLRRRLAFAAVTLAHGGVPFALDQLPTGSFTRALRQTGTTYTPCKSSKSRKRARYRWEDTSDAANRETNK